MWNVNVLFIRGVPDAYIKKGTLPNASIIDDCGGVTNDNIKKYESRFK